MTRIAHNYLGPHITRAMGLSKNELLVLNVCSLKILLREELQALMYGPEQLERIPLTTDGSDWSALYGTAGSIQYTLQASESTSGTNYAHAFSLAYPGLSMTSIRQLHNWENREFIIQFDIDGVTHYVGSPEAGLKLTWRMATSEDGFTLQFVLDDSEPMYTSPELDLFIIENGKLIQNFEVEDTFTLNANGELEVEGPNENRYYIDGRKLYIS